MTRSGGGGGGGGGGGAGVLAKLVNHSASLVVSLAAHQLPEAAQVLNWAGLVLAIASII